MKPTASLVKIFACLWLALASGAVWAQAPSDPAPVAAPMIGTQYFPILPQNAPPDAEPQLVPVVSSLPLAEPQPSVTHAVLFIHDLTRNPTDGVATLATLAGSDNAASQIIAPQFLIEADRQRFQKFLPEQGAHFALWPVNHWQDGGESLAKPPNKGISSFTVVDMLLLFLTSRTNYPNLKHITLAGHGMGADFVLRYAALGHALQVLEQDGIELRFLAANPASYLYVTQERPTATKGPPKIPDAADCTRYHDYPYGLANLNAYGRVQGINDIRLAYPARRVLYLLGGAITPDNFLDQDCAAKLQGPDRLTRGTNFEAALMRNFGDVARQTQQFVIVPKAGYDPVALFGSYCGMAVLFGDGVCKIEKN
jgi:pimeloyl-ACP methyl ester carboxylesterase